MTLRQLLITVFIATVICWLILTMVLVKIDPLAAGIFGFILFYLSLFFALIGTFFLVSFGFRKIFTNLVLEYKIVGTSLRQSIFFSLMIVGALFLESREFLTWWNLLLLILGLTILEFFFLSARKRL